jgi:phosphonate transport system substrate-binding protein
MRFLLILAALFGPIAASLAAEAPLRFAPLPMISQESMAREYIGPVRYLEEKSGRPIVLVHTQDYRALIERFRRNEIDLAYVGPLPYVMLSQDFEAAEPLVRFLEPDGRTSYTCALVVFGNDKPSPETMQGKRLALPDKLSTCAEIGTGAILRQMGMSLGVLERNHLDRHDAVAMAVILGQADLGGMKTAIARKYASLGLRVVAESPPMPGFVLVANRNTVPAETRRQLREALLALHPRENPADAERMRDWGGGMRHGAVTAEEADFDALRRQWVDHAKDH